MINTSQNMVAGTALETLRTRFKFVARGWAVAGLVGIAPLVGMMILWFLATSSMTHSLISNRYESNSPPHAWHVTNPDGRSSLVQIEHEINGEKVITKNLTRDEYEEAIAPFVSQNYWISPQWLFNFLLCLGLAFVYPISKKVHRRFFEIGQENTSNKRIKGEFDLITGQELDAMVRQDGGGDFTFFSIAFPKHGFRKGTAVCGMAGSGKSLGFNDFIKQVSRKQNIRLFINDPSGEFYTSNFRPGIDVMFNPAMEGSVPWSIFLELLTESDARELALGAIPEKDSGPNSFFDDAARSLLSALILSLAKRGVTDTSELARQFFNCSEEEMMLHVAGTAAADLVGGSASSMAQSVKASASIYLNGVLAIASGTWTIREFLQRPLGNIYVIGNDRDLYPLKRMFFMSIASAIEKMGVITTETKYLMLLDEYPMLGDIKIDEMMNQQRKYGLGVVCGMQHPGQMIMAMGETRSSITMGAFKNYLQLQTAGEATKSAEERFGVQYVEVVSQSQQLSVTEARDSIGISKGAQMMPLVMASEINQLTPNTGYLQLAGETRPYPTAKINYFNWLDKDAKGVSYADYLQTVVAERPKADPRFSIIRANPKDLKRTLAADLLAQSIAKLENRLEGLTQKSAKQKVAEQIANKTAQLEKLLAGEDVEITEDELVIDLETGENFKGDEKQPEWGGF